MPPHVLIFPLPMQGPVNCMLKLAELLCISGVSVTVLNTHHIHRSLLRHSSVADRFSRYPNIRFETISDGLGEDHPRSGERIVELFEGMRAVTEPVFREMMVSGRFSRRSESPVTVVIPDGSFAFALDVAEEAGVPLIYFETVSPSALWTYLCLPNLVGAGEVPINGSDLDVMIKRVPGTETFLRGRDLPSFCRLGDIANPLTEIVMKEARYVPRAHGVVLNTFQALDASILLHMRTLCPNIYCIGPLHTLFKSHVTTKPKPTTQMTQYDDVSNSLWKEDVTCLSWLDMQATRSVIYVSIGSMAKMTVDQFFEFWHGLVNSGKPFLWAQRPGSIIGEYDVDQVPKRLVDETKQRGFITTWVPQEAVLAHSAIGGFLTHSGWNSTLESIMEGVPMICWPQNVDQQVNSRFVSEVWKIGIDIKDTCDRVVIAKAVQDVIDARRSEFSESIKTWAELGCQSIGEDGSSVRDLNRLIESIGSL